LRLHDISQIVKRNLNILTTLLPILSFVIPFLILYSLYPLSFEQIFQGRTYYLFFLWLVSLEIILNWEKVQKTKLSKLKSVRTVLFVIVLILPTLYVIAANFCGLNAMIEDYALQHLPPEDPELAGHARFLPLSIEYLIFAVLFCLTILVAYGIHGLVDFSISALLLGTIGVLFTINNLVPVENSPVQIFVPATATLAANVLNLMGYQTTMSVGTFPYYGRMPVIMVEGYPLARFAIAWPCAGVESLLIYTVTILLFLKKTDIPWKYRIVYFVIGAVVTYFINVLRIVTVFLIAIENGPDFMANFQRFHNYYGPLYSIVWIVSYPLIILGSRALWGKIRNWKAGTKDDAKVSTGIKLSE